MSSNSFNLIENSTVSTPSGMGMRIGIVVSEWNGSITGDLQNGAVETLKQNGVDENDILIYSVPGSFELIYGCAQLAKSGKVDAVIASYDKQPGTGRRTLGRPAWKQRRRIRGNRHQDGRILAQDKITASAAYGRQISQNCRTTTATACERLNKRTTRYKKIRATSRVAKWGRL